MANWTGDCDGERGERSNASCCEMRALACGDRGRSERFGVALYVLSMSIVRIARLEHTRILNKNQKNELGSMSDQRSEQNCITCRHHGDTLKSAKNKFLIHNKMHTRQSTWDEVPSQIHHQR